MFPQKNAILIAHNFVSYCGVRKAEGLGNNKDLDKWITADKYCFRKRRGFAQSISSGLFELLCSLADRKSVV